MRSSLAQRIRDLTRLTVDSGAKLCCLEAATIGSRCADLTSATECRRLSSASIIRPQLWDSGHTQPLQQAHRKWVSTVPAAASGASSPEAAEINPLLQTPRPVAGAKTGEGVPSFYGPGKAVAKLRGIAMSPKKMNHFVALVRRLHVEDALAQCRLSTKKAAKITAGAILSARANAEKNHGLDPDRLTVDIINVGRGTHLKRMSIHGRGRQAIRLRYRCHIEVILKQSEQKPRMRYVQPLLERPARHLRIRSGQASGVV